MHFKIATPERVMLDTEADSVSLPTTFGEITILPHHVPLVANLVAGEIKYKQQGIEKFFAVSGGVIEVKSRKAGPASGGKETSEVVVLADTAEFGHEIDLKRAEEARAQAQKLMSQIHKDEKSYADAAAWLERSQVRVKVAKKHRTHTHQHIES